MKSKTTSKMLSCIILICMAVSFVVICTGCIPPSMIKKLQPTLGHWVYDDKGNRIGCNAGGTECAYIATECAKVEIPVSLAMQLIEWQANAAQL